MIDINLIRENPDLLKEDLKKRKDDEKLKWIDKVIKLDKKWKKKKAMLDGLRKERNQLSQEINKAKKEGKSAKTLISKAAKIPKQLKDLDEEVVGIKEQVDYYLMRLPNITHESVPYGCDDTENQEVKKWGKITKPKFELKSHGEFLEELGGADFDRATKISGAGFFFLKGEFALLNQALIMFALDTLTKKGYTLIQPPHMMRRKPYEGVTDLGDFEDVMYKVENEDEYLIATSEHPMGAMYQGEVLSEEELPIKLCGLSHCFRKEIGSHGVDTKGLFRVHQFEKVEQFVFCKPEESWKFHEEILKNAEELFKKLALPYRIVNICTGDIGTVAAKKYDIEAWYPRQQAYKEVVSCSNCTDYQARRLKIKWGKVGGDKEVLHTLNSTMVALGRALVAIVENYQQKDGSLAIPKVLQPYMGGKKVIKKQ